MIIRISGRLSWPLLAYLMRGAILALILAGLVCTCYGDEPTLAKAQALLKQERAQDALPILLELHRSDPSNANICQQTGIAYTQLEDFTNAAKFYREALRLNPNFIAARKNLGTVLWFMDRKDESEREFIAVMKAAPADPVPHLYLGLAAHARRDFSRAKAEFEKAGPLASDNFEVLPAVFESDLGAGDPKSAEKSLNKLAQAHQDSPELWCTLADSYDRQGKPQEAYSAYNRALDTGHTSAENYVAFAEFASAHGNNDFARKVAARGLERNPDSPPLVFEQGLLYALDGDRASAEKYFRGAIKLKPGWALPLLALGVSQLESGDAPAASVTFEKARTADPSDFRAHYLYATALFRDNSANATALQALHKAIELNPRDARSYALLGRIELAHGRSERAAAAWVRTLEIDPENSTALYQLGLLYKKEGKAAEAGRLLERFQRIRAKKHDEEESLVPILRVVPEKRAP
jgi:Flp pilus assembly protein TadD